MTQRLIGGPGSRRRHWSVLCCLALAMGAGVLAISGAQAFGPIGDTLFELDASLDPGTGASPKAAITDNSGAGLPDDWDRVCHKFTSGAQCAAAADDHAIARSFDSETAADGTADQRTIFTTGGSKDQQPLNKWQWKDNVGGLPDKDNLLHAMAARYTSGTNAFIFFGADRFDNSGDAQIGFWFFKTTVCTNDDGSFGNALSGTTCSGTATHTAGKVPHDPNNTGDVLILSDFTNGGVQPTIRVFEYVGDCTGCTGTPSDGPLNLLGGTADDIRDCALV